MDAMKLGENLLEILDMRGWIIGRSVTDAPLLPPPLVHRYPRLPEDLISFLGSIETCTNAAEDIWFLTRADYQRTDDSAFRWNEFELMSLEGDGGAAAQIRQFWDLHFPFMLAVHSDYDYLAVCLDPPVYGQVVHGCGPSFEETSLVADSFAQFMSLFAREAAGDQPAYPLSCFV